MRKTELSIPALRGHRPVRPHPTPRGRRGVGRIPLFLCALGVLVIGHNAAAVELISVDIHAVAGNAPSNTVAVNADGTFVAFYSDADDLVTGDRNGFRDVFVRNRQTHTTELVSVNDAGIQANADSHALGDAPAINGDGEVVAFYSDATNLVAGDANGQTDVFVRLRGPGKTQIVSLAADGSQGNGPSLSPSISADARYVAFQSLASNLVSDDTNQVADIFVRDLVANATERVCDQIQGNNYSYGPSISADGNFVAFTSAATNLVPHDTNHHLDVFVCNRQTGAIDIVSISTGGVQGNGDSILPAISADGRFVAFKSVASNLVPNDNNGVADVFVRDRLMGTTERVSVNTRGGDSDGASFPPSIDYAGRFVAFGSEADNLVPHDANDFSDVFVRDRQIGFTLEVDLNDQGQQANNGTLDVPPSVSGDGKAIGFISLASNLVNNDFNGVSDVYITSNPFFCESGICPTDLVCSNGMCQPENFPTATPTATATQTPAASATTAETPSVTPAPSETPTASSTASATATEIATATATAMVVATDTPTETVEPTATETPAAGATSTETGTATASETPTANTTTTTTATTTATETPAGSATPTGSAVATTSPTETATPSASATATETASATATETSTATASATASETATLPETETPTATAPATSTSTAVASATATETAAPTASSTATQTSIPTATASSTASSTATQTSIPTSTATTTAPIITFTPTLIPTATATATATASHTAAPTSTATSSATTAPTSTQTPAATATATLVRTGTATVVVPTAAPVKKLDKDACQCAVSSPSQTRRGAVMWLSGVAALLLRRRRFKSPRGQG
ncbi:MAG: TolB family protein [Candidatus Binatia bacterium]